MVRASAGPEGGRGQPRVRTQRAGLPRVRPPGPRGAVDPAKDEEFLKQVRARAEEQRKRYELEKKREQEREREREQEGDQTS